MNYKFIQPVSMRVTKEQYERDLKEPLLAMGYKEKLYLCWMVNSCDYLVTNFNKEDNKIGCLSKSSIHRLNRYFIPEYNPKLFLAIAAMTDKESPIVGEWLVCTAEVTNMGGNKVGDFVKNENPNMILNWFRRAALQELIEKFTNKESIKENAMKIEVIKPKEDKPYWDYPCKGIRKKDGVVVGFEKFGSGCVLENGQSKLKLYTSLVFLDMADFTPIKEKGNNYDWSNPKFPILVKGIGEDIFTINGFDEVDNSVSITTFSFSGKVHYWCEERAEFSSEEGRNKWLKSLEIIPKGTEIKITF